MDDAPSFTVCFSREDIHGDDRSELTGMCDDVDCLSHEDDFGIERAADPYYYHALDGSRISQDGNEELAEIKMHLVRNQEKIDMLSSKLSQCEVHIEALKAERSALVNELAAPSVKMQPPEEWFSKVDDGSGGGGLIRDTNAKLMAENCRLQVAVNVMRKSFHSYIKDRRRISAEDGQAIGDLQQENELLRQRLGLSPTTNAENPVILSQCKRTAEAYPSDSSDFTKLNHSFKAKRANLSKSESTAGTCPLDVSDVTLPQLGVPLSALRSMALSDCESEHTEIRSTSGSNQSTGEDKNDLPLGCARPLNRDRSDFIRVLRVPDDKANNKHPTVKETTFDGGPIKTRNEDSESTVASDPGAYNLQEEAGDFVDFDEALGTKTALNRWKSLPEKAAQKNAGGLLVDFGETRRPKRTPERWQGFKWRF